MIHAALGTPTEAWDKIKKEIPEQKIIYQISKHPQIPTKHNGTNSKQPVRNFNTKKLSIKKWLCWSMSHVIDCLHGIDAPW